VALGALVALALALLEDDHLVAATVFDYGGLDRSARELGSANAQGAAFASCENVGDLDSGAGFGVGETIHHEDIAFADRELLPLSENRRFHLKMETVSEP